MDRFTMEGYNSLSQASDLLSGHVELSCLVEGRNHALLVNTNFAEVCAAASGKAGPERREVCTVALLGVADL